MSFVYVNENEDEDWDKCQDVVVVPGINERDLLAQLNIGVYDVYSIYFGEPTYDGSDNLISVRIRNRIRTTYLSEFRQIKKWKRKIKK